MIGFIILLGMFLGAAIGGIQGFFMGMFLGAVCGMVLLAAGEVAGAVLKLYAQGLARLERSLRIRK